MKPLPLALMFLTFLISLPALAEKPLIEPQTQGEVSFVSGGIGSNERDALQTMRADYNLRLLFALQGTGEYTSDVNINITDSKGNSLLETTSKGPMLFAKLKPGRYTVKAELNGRVLDKPAKVRHNHTTSLSFIWPKD
jgi:hypothetical protein